MLYDKLIFEISQKGRIAHDLKVETNNLKKLYQNIFREII